MIFGKHINRYYLKFAHMLILGLASLIMVDVLQLEIPKLYQLVINGVSMGRVYVDGAEYVFDMDFLLDRICMPMVGVILAVVFGRFLWRYCFFGAGGFSFGRAFNFGKFINFGFCNAFSRMNFRYLFYKGKSETEALSFRP